MARPLNTSSKDLPGEHLRVLGGREAHGLRADSAQVKEQLIKLDEESEEAVSETRKVSPIHFVNMDFPILPRVVTAADAFVPDCLISRGGIRLPILFQLFPQELMLTLF